MDDKATVYVWPDGSWMRADTYNETVHAYKGDDYYIHYVPIELTDDDIEELVEEHHRTLSF